MIYKSNDHKKWKIPGFVVGHDSQQIPIKHGSTYVRKHPCRVLLKQAGPSNTSCDNLASTTSVQKETLVKSSDEESSTHGMDIPSHVPSGITSSRVASRALYRIEPLWPMILL